MCKHKIALFFSIFPKEAEQYFKEIEEYEKEQEEYEKERYKKIRRHVNVISKNELREELFVALVEAEEYGHNRYW